VAFIRISSMAISHDGPRPFDYDVCVHTAVNSPDTMVVGEAFGLIDTFFYSRLLMVIGPWDTWEE
jgi:hypothetical protein